MTYKYPSTFTVLCIDQIVVVFMCNPLATIYLHRLQNCLLISALHNRIYRISIFKIRNNEKDIEMVYLCVSFFMWLNIPIISLQVKFEYLHIS